MYEVAKLVPLAFIHITQKQSEKDLRFTSLGSGGRLVK